MASRASRSRTRPTHSRSPTPSSTSSSKASRSGGSGRAGRANTTKPNISARRPPPSAGFAARRRRRATARHGGGGDSPVTAQKTGQAPNPALGQKQGDVPAITMRFGGGMNTRELAPDIDDRECAAGSQNFGLDLFSAAFFPRAPFDLVGTAPNGQSINGFAQLQKQDGTLSTLIQAGTALYKWDGVSFTNIATVPFGSKLRGAYNANFPALNKVLVTDLALQQVVSTWDGTTFAALAHNLGGGVNFFAKYSLVSKERAWFANVTAGSATPPLIPAPAGGGPPNLTTPHQPPPSPGGAGPSFLPTTEHSPLNRRLPVPPPKNT